MSKRQQRRRAVRRRAHMAMAGGGMAAVASLATGGVAHAATTFTVTNLNDSGTGSLRAAIEAVNADTADTSAPGDTITFASGLSGTITLTSGELDLTRNARIFGPGAELVSVHAAAGHRVLYTDAYATIFGLTITGGAPASTDHSGDGGGILANAPLRLDDVDVSANTATGNGGGIDAAGGYLSMLASTISGNAAAGKGGGAYGYDGISAYNSTITANSAPTGAGLSIYDPLTLEGSTVVNNVVTGGGQGGQLQFVSNYNLYLYDSIVAGSGAAPDIVLPSGSSQSIQFSLVRNPSAGGAGDASINTDATDVTGLDPQLGPLGENGGTTPTMVPLPTSPVLDRGNSFRTSELDVDQRGLPRPFALPTVGFVPPGGDRSDIGAVEAETPTLAAISPITGGPGNPVTITGLGFTGATQVLFGAAPASSFTVLNDETIVATPPAQNGGSAYIRVVTPLGQTGLAGPFTFQTFTPSVSRPHAKLRGRTVNTGVKVSCPAGGFRCSGSWKATATIKRHKTKLGLGSISLSAGRSKTITFKLSSAAIKQLKRSGRLSVTIQIMVADGNGQPVKVNRTITLKHKTKGKK